MSTPGDIAGEPCAAAELRTLFLFEKLTDDQLDWLCREGRVRSFEPGTVYAEGEPAEFLYVLLSGTVALSRRIGADEVEVNRTSGRGVYGGAFFAYLGDRVPQIYNNTMRAIEPSRFLLLAADKYATDDPSGSRWRCTCSTGCVSAGWPSVSSSTGGSG